MDPDGSLKSIEFKTSCDDCSGVSSVRVSLSNGFSSPVFEKSDHTHYNHETFNFDPNTPIRAVEAYDGGNKVYRIRFMDSAGRKVYEYNP